MQNDRLLRALSMQEVDATPIWIMRQAGRYLPEYRKTRAGVKDFMSLCRTPELACEVTMQPLRRFDLDAAILFSDILTVPEAMGLPLQFVEGVGPVFGQTISSEQDLSKLKIPDPEDELRYVMDAVRHIKRALSDKLPLIGFSGSPWTLATYMVEGKGSKQFNVIRKMLYANPQLLTQLLEKLTHTVTEYLKAQISAGVDVLMVFDSWGGILSPVAYGEFSLRFMKKIVEDLKAFNANIPIILFTKGGMMWLDKLADSGAEGLGIDWSISIGEAKKMVGNKVCLQGNLDPAALYGSYESIDQMVKTIINEFGPESGHIFNLGHGIYPDIEPDKVAYLVDAVHRYS